MSKPSIHDNNVYAYSVLCEEQRVILYTEFKDGTLEEYTDVLFCDVLAHHFESALETNILFDITEVEPGEIVREWSEVFARLDKHNWPPVEIRDTDSFAATLIRQGVHAYQIHSSYGLGGWVLAKKMDVLPRPAKMRS